LGQNVGFCNGSTSEVGIRCEKCAGEVGRISCEEITGCHYLGMDL